MLQYNFVIAHILPSTTTAADYLSRIQSNPNEKLHFSIIHDKQVESIEVNIQSSGDAEEDQVYVVRKTMWMKINFANTSKHDLTK